MHYEKLGFAGGGQGQYCYLVFRFTVICLSQTRKLFSICTVFHHLEAFIRGMSVILLTVEQGYLCEVL